MNRFPMNVFSKPYHHPWGSNTCLRYGYTYSKEISKDEILEKAGFQNYLDLQLPDYTSLYQNNMPVLIYFLQQFQPISERNIHIGFFVVEYHVMNLGRQALSKFIQPKLQSVNVSALIVRDEQCSRIE